MDNPGVGKTVCLLYSHTSAALTALWTPGHLVGGQGVLQLSPTLSTWPKGQKPEVKGSVLPHFGCQSQVRVVPCAADRLAGCRLTVP